MKPRWRTALLSAAIVWGSVALSQLESGTMLAVIVAVALLGAARLIYAWSFRRN